MASFSFNTAGSTPVANPLSAGTLNLNTTPASKALNSALPTATWNPPYVSQPSQEKLPTATWNPSPPATPLKSQTQTNVDGSSVTNTYHAPTPGLMSPQSPSNNSVGYSDSVAPQGTPVNQGQQYNAASTSPVQTQNQSTDPTLLSTLKNLVEQSQKGSPQMLAAQDAYSKAVGNLSSFNQNLATQYGNIESNPIPLEFQQGREQVIARQAASQQAALQGAVNQQQAAIGQAQTAQGQQLGALTSAAGLLTPGNQFTQVPYSNQLINSQGQNVLGGQGGSLTPQAQGQQLAQAVVSGQMDFNTALGQMNAYGPAGASALRNAILASNPNFNFNLSQSSATTQAQGQQIQTQAKTANSALDSLASLFSSLSSSQTGGIPLTNAIGQWIGSQLGDSALSTYKANLADARAQLEGVLTATGATTPTGAEAMALQYLPENMTPQQFQQNVGTAQNPGIVRQLIAQKVQQFTQSGQQQNPQQSTSNSQSGNIWSW